MFQTFRFSYWEGVTGIFFSTILVCWTLAEICLKVYSLYSSDLCVLPVRLKKAWCWHGLEEQFRTSPLLLSNSASFFISKFIFFSVSFSSLLFHATIASHTSRSAPFSKSPSVLPTFVTYETPKWAASHAGLRLLYESLVFSHEVCYSYKMLWDATRCNSRCCKDIANSWVSRNLAKILYCTCV